MKERPLAVASIGAAIVASLCCIGPLVAVLLGLGTFGAAAFFEHFRPYFLGVTALLLAGAWYLAYRKNAACTDGFCPPESPVRHTRLLLWIATPLVALFAALPYYSLLVWKAVAESRGLLVMQPTASTLSSVTLQIEGMTCGGCAAAVQASLSQLKGVSQASVSFEEKSGTVRYDPSRVKVGQILQAVEKAGYKATVKR